MIKLQHVSAAYDHPVLQDLNLEIPAGELTAVIGTNGSGKSTLAQILAGLKLDFKGKITIDDQPLTRHLATCKLRQLIGLVLQHPEHQLVFDRVDTELNFARENLGLPTSPEFIKKALCQVGLDLEYSTNPWQLSGGQQQRLAIASQLTLEPKYLLLDEATTMLDYPGRQLIYRILPQLTKQGLGVVIFTNQLEEILLASQIILLDHGQAFCYSKPALLGKLSILTDHGLAIPPLLRLASRQKLTSLTELETWLSHGDH